MILLEIGIEMSVYELDDGCKFYKLGNMELFVGDGYFMMKNVFVIQEEDYLIMINDYWAWVWFQLSEQCDGVIVKEVFISWVEVVRVFEDWDEFGKNYFKKCYYKVLYEVLQLEIVGIDDLFEKVEVIYWFLGSKVAWDDELRYFFG